MLLWEVTAPRPQDPSGGGSRSPTEAAPQPTQPEPTHPKATHPGQAAVCKRYAGVAPKPKPNNCTPQRASQLRAPAPPPPPPPAQLPVTHSDDYIWEEAKLAITDHAAPPTLHRLAPSLQGWRTGLIRYNDLQPPAVSTSSFTTQATQHHSHRWPAKLTKSSTSAPHDLPSLAASIQSPS